MKPPQFNAAFHSMADVMPCRPLTLSGSYRVIKLPALIVINAERERRPKARTSSRPRRHLLRLNGRSNRQAVDTWTVR